jgi:hypothetical protein
MVKKIVLDKKISDIDISKKEGYFFSDTDFDTIITEDYDVFRKENHTELLLLSFRKNVLSKKNCIDSYNSLKEYAKRKHNNRGSAGGLLDVSKLPNYVKEITNKTKFRTYYKGKDNKEKKDHISNYVQSGIIGYFDRYDRNQLGKDKEKPKIPCRTTKFTKEQVEKWDKCLPLIKEINKHFKKQVSNRHKIQLTRAKLTKEFQILNTAFSTITINLNYRTALHKDKGDLEEGFGNLIVLEGDKCETGKEPYSGGYLGFPQYGVCVDVRQGDFLAMDVHQFHCNTEIIGENCSRLSIVCYLRKNMIKCLNK